jgi:hypothetical protein
VKTSKETKKKASATLPGKTSCGKQKNNNSQSISEAFAFFALLLMRAAFWILKRVWVGGWWGVFWVELGLVVSGSFNVSQKEKKIFQFYRKVETNSNVGLWKEMLGS